LTAVLIYRPITLSTSKDEAVYDFVTLEGFSVIVSSGSGEVIFEGSGGILTPSAAALGKRTPPGTPQRNPSNLQRLSTTQLRPTSISAKTSNSVSVHIRRIHPYSYLVHLQFSPTQNIPSTDPTDFEDIQIYCNVGSDAYAISSGLV